MRKWIIIAVTIIVLIGIGFYIKKAAQCFASSGAIELVPSDNPRKGQAITPHLRMLRIAAPGCYTGASSDSYKNVSCGYRIQGSQEWSPGTLISMVDSAVEYVVQCRIPAPSEKEKRPVTIEYYFEYSAWGNPAERKEGKFILD